MDGILLIFLTQTTTQLINHYPQPNGMYILSMMDKIYNQPMGKVYKKNHDLGIWSSDIGELS